MFSSMTRRVPPTQSRSTRTRPRTTIMANWRGIKDVFPLVSPPDTPRRVLLVRSITKINFVVKQTQLFDKNLPQALLELSIFWEYTATLQHREGSLEKPFARSPLSGYVGEYFGADNVSMVMGDFLGTLDVGGLWQGGVDALLAARTRELVREL